MDQQRIDDYKKWLVKTVDKTATNPYDEFGWRELEAGLTFSKLYSRLWDEEFDCSKMHPNDMNRWHDGRVLRSEYAYRKGLDRYYIYEEIPGPCRFLEFLAALAMRVEFVMQDPDVGDRTYIWFMGILQSLGLFYCNDWCYDDEYVTMVLNRFHNMEYEPDGRGGCFYIPDTMRNLKELQIWDQMSQFTTWRNYVGEYEGLLHHGSNQEWMNQCEIAIRSGKEYPDLSKYIPEDMKGFFGME